MDSEDSLVDLIHQKYRQHRWPFLRSYFFAKIRVFFEVQDPRWEFLKYEWMYTLSNVLRTFRPNSKWTPAWQGPESVQTRFGRFVVRSGTQDPAMISPAFERRDFDKVYEIIRKKTQGGRPVLFVDIGANIGKFCISVARDFAADPVFCLAFEPVPAHVQMIYQCRDLNQISAAKLNVQQTALHEKAGKMSMSLDLRSFGNSQLGHQAGYQRQQIDVDVVRLDHFDWSRLFPPLIGKKPVLVCKMDVEGSEGPILKGAANFFDLFDDITLVTEDTHKSEELYSILRKLRFRFLDKLTPYNSWWVRTDRP